MIDYKTRKAQANSYYQAGLKRVSTTKEPDGQNFPCGSRVRIVDDLGRSMAHFKSGVNATVEHTYAHAYGGNDVESYSLNIDGFGSCAWYYEWQLTQITEIVATNCITSSKEDIKMEKKLEEIKVLLKATNLTDKEIPLLAMFISTLKLHQIDAVYEVLYQLIWERKLAK